MGLFSRKDRTSKTPAVGILPLSTSGSTNSLTSADSGSIKSPISSTTSSHHPSYQSYQSYQYATRAINRSSAGTAATTVSSTSAPMAPMSPMTPMTPAHLPKFDMPRPPDPALDPAGYLRSLPAVRERCQVLTQKALHNDLQHFDVDMTKFEDVVTFVAQIIKRDYDMPYVANIPAYGRHQHFAVGGRDRIALLLATWPTDSVDSTERCRRLIDLFLVSVLLDAGAGSGWKYTSAENGRMYRRSEGIAIASLDMFKSGLFSGQGQAKTRVDREGLQTLTVESLAKGLQSRPGNTIAGLEGRANLLIRLGHALGSYPDVFGPEGRPGNMVDYLLAHPTTQASSMPIVMLPVLWKLLMDCLEPIWPDTRTALNGATLGDAWPCHTMPQPPSDSAESPGGLSRTKSSSPRGSTTPTFSPFPSSSSSGSSTAKNIPKVEAWEAIVPFHKMAQWLTYSLMQPMQSILKIHFAGTEQLTGLPEYRNGGLFVDLGVLNLKQTDVDRGLEHYRAYCERVGHKSMEVAPMFYPGDDVVVEWRAVTVGFLDRLCRDVNKALQNDLQGYELSLSQLLEAGSWKGGREMAEMSRPNTREPPILIDSDGTVF